MQTLPEWLQWVVFSGGAGVVASGAIELLEKWAAFKAAWDKLPAELKRYASFGLAAGLGALGFWARVKLGYSEAPVGTTAWFEAVFAIVVSQVVHARIALSRR